MSQIYNLFLDGLAPDRSPEPDAVRDVCRQLGRDLRRELRRRNLWTASPKLVGLEDATWTGDALRELAHDAYVHSFVRRLRGLTHQRRAGIDVHGLVRRNLRNFLTERQKGLDPIGYHVFHRACQAARQALATRDLHTESEPGDLAAGSVLTFVEEPGEPVTPEILDEIVPAWSEDLFPDLVTATTNSVRGVVARLTRHLVELRDAGVDAFRVGDLVDALKRDLRRRWQARIAGDLGVPASEDLDEDSPPTVLVPPEGELEGQDHLAAIVACVTRGIAALDAGAVRAGLWKIWPYVRSCAAQNLARPPWTVISREVGLSRKRLPQLYARLGEMTRRCREALDGDRRTTTEANDPADEPRTAPRAAHQGR